GHYEIFGVASDFRERIFPGATLTTRTAAGAFNNSVWGGGIGANARWMMAQKKVELGVHYLGGSVAPPANKPLSCWAIQSESERAEARTASLESRGSRPLSRHPPVSKPGPRLHGLRAAGPAPQTATRRSAGPRSSPGRGPPSDSPARSSGAIDRGSVVAPRAAAGPASLQR